MKTILPLLITLIISTSTLAQKLTLPELISLCGKQNWESVNAALLAKGWVYYDSKKGNSYSYNTISWSFNKQDYNDKASAWFSLYTYGGEPNKIAYEVFNKPAYTLIQNSLASSGFKLIGSAIEDNELISTYANSTYLLKINTEKREDNDWSDRSLTAYRITIIKKAGIYDPNNGKKFTYHENGRVKTEYLLKDGKFNGIFKSYYDNGQLLKQGHYTNGIANGKFVEYDEDGNKEAEYTMVNDDVHGMAIVYHDGLKSVEKEYYNGTLHGKYFEYHYDDDNNLSYNIVGTHLNGEQDGKWVAYFVNNGQESIAEYRHYKKGLKHGEVKEYTGTDTVEIATYANGILNGPYERQILRRVYDTESGDYDDVWVKESQGHYKDDVKVGHWTFYGFIIKYSEGKFVNGEKDGKWIYYLPVSERTGEIMLETNYVAGKKNGLQKRYYVVDEVEDNTDGQYATKFKSIPVFVTEHFRNDLRNGDYEYRDSTNTLVDKGVYVNDEKHGHWIEGYIYDKPDGSQTWIYFAGEYKNGKEEGKWLSYFDRSLIRKTLHYKSGELHGEYIDWNELGKPAQKKMFQNGQFTEMTIYDSAGEKIMTKYELYDETSSSLMCRQIEYLGDKSISQEYRIFKQEKIHHNDFEKVFLNLTGITSNKIYGYKDGIHRITTISGEVLVNGRYFKEDKVGLWTYSYPDQRVVLEQSYEKGQPTTERYVTPAGQPFSGDFVFHNTSIGLTEERKIKNGLRNGRTAYMDPNNKVIRKENYKEGVLK